MLGLKYLKNEDKFYRLLSIIIERVSVA